MQLSTDGDGGFDADELQLAGALSAACGRAPQPLEDDLDLDLSAGIAASLGGSFSVGGSSGSAGQSSAGQITVEIALEIRPWFGRVPF